MSQFNNVAVDVAANVYFDGGVISRSVHFADGSHKTLGVALARRIPIHYRGRGVDGIFVR